MTDVSKELLPLDENELCARCGCYRHAHGEDERCEPVGWTFTRAQPTTDVVEREDAIDEALRKLHYEAFVAGVCYGRDDWPTDDEEWADLRRGIESEAIGEHYEGWSPETKAAIAALTNPPAPSNDG